MQPLHVCIVAWCIVSFFLGGGSRLRVTRLSFVFVSKCNVCGVFLMCLILCLCLYVFVWRIRVFVCLLLCVLLLLCVVCCVLLCVIVWCCYSALFVCCCVCNRYICCVCVCLNNCFAGVSVVLLLPMLNM